MKVKELINKLKTYDENAFVGIEFEYNDSDEGQCYGSIEEFNFEYTKGDKINFLVITEKDTL